MLSGPGPPPLPSRPPAPGPPLLPAVPHNRNEPTQTRGREDDGASSQPVLSAHANPPPTPYQTIPLGGGWEGQMPDHILHTEACVLCMHAWMDVCMYVPL